VVVALEAAVLEAAVIRGIALSPGTQLSIKGVLDMVQSTGESPYQHLLVDQSAPPSAGKVM